MTRPPVWALALAGLILLTGLASATTHYVNGTIGDDQNDGSRSRPWKTITHALDNIRGAEPSLPGRLEITSGNYSATANGEVFPLQVRNYVTIVGMGPESTVLDAGGAAHAILLDDVLSVTIEDMALTGGVATGLWPDACGGGICAIDSEFTVRNCKMYSNSATGVEKHGAGAGIYLYGECSPLITGCEFVTNEASTGGAGICSEYYCTPNVKDCKFDRNVGVAIYSCRWSSVAVEDCSITENACGITLTDFSSVLVVSSNIARNSADTGAAVNCLHHCQATLRSCALWSNVAIGDGGAISCEREGTCRITDCEISLNTSGQDGGGIWCVGSTLELLRSSLWANTARSEGGAIFCGQDSKATISETDIAGNDAPWGAGAAFCDNAGGTLTSCNLTQNEASSGGGALFCRDYSSPELLHCELLDNAADGAEAIGGGAVFCEYFCDVNLTNCLIANNAAEGPGGGLFCMEYCKPTLTNVTLWDNAAAGGAKSIHCDGYCKPQLKNCIAWGGADGIAALDESEVSTSFSCIFGGNSESGDNNIDQDPRFATADGSGGQYYLSAQAAKQTEDSPCIDAGLGQAEQAAGGLSFRTTRTDSGFDRDDVDLGYHYPAKVASIRCYLNASEYHIADLLDLWIRVANPEDEARAADVYIAILMPLGQIFCLGDTGLVAGLATWKANYEMPAGYLLGPESVLQMQVPGGCPAGAYLAASALFLPGSMTEISEISLAEFTISQ
ncbi:MAG: right-handed parallel beta-helix repeat-containing protein [Candidatus Coatesbacteria bacterium]|nr:right-handed parallel beta-helix repeat-containing protein [Candidatus Coatesbacteria bacterium]